MDRWQVIKDGWPIRLCNTLEEAEEVYIEFEADEIRCIPDEGPDW
jgi:hypothetical protein